MEVRSATFGTTPQFAAVEMATMWTWVEAWLASVDGPNPRTPFVMLQPADEVAVSIDQVSPVGRVSLTVTAKALPTPVFVTSTTNPSWSPALTTSSSAVLVMTTSGQSTSIVALSVLLSRTSAPSFVAATVTVLSIWPQSAATVPRDSVIEREALTARSPKAQVSRLLPSIWHEAASAPPSVQEPAGSWSFWVTPNATPGPWLVTVMVKTAGSPAWFARCRP